MARPDDIVEQLMNVMVGLKRSVRTDHAGQELPYSHHAVLKQLEKGSATTADLARAELMTPQAMGAIVAALEAGGYLSRRDDADDARRKLLALTAAGRKVLAANRAARHRWLASLVAEQFDSDEQRTIAAALALLGRLIDAQRRAQP